MNHYQTLQEFCYANNRPALLRQWNTEKNKTYSPENIAAGTARKVWWKDEYGHEWEQSVYNRTVLGRGCPVCANRIIEPEYNDLATTYPEVAVQWDFDKNGKIVSHGSA